MESTVRLGGHESTILTNRSKYLTIVSDSPSKSSNVGSEFSRNVRSLRGSRPMHRSTLCFEDKPFKIDYITTTHKAYSGRQDKQRNTPPYKSQSLHHSHFSIGITRDIDLKTQTMNSHDRKTIIPASKLHEDRVRWNDHVFAGNLMNRSLRHVGFDKASHETTYGNVHDLLGKQIPCGLPRITQKPEKFNIISGEYTGQDEPRSFRLCSGNKILQRIRHESSEGILG